MMKKIYFIVSRNSDGMVNLISPGAERKQDLYQTLEDLHNDLINYDCMEGVCKERDHFTVECPAYQFRVGYAIESRPVMTTKGGKR